MPSPNFLAKFTQGPSEPAPLEKGKKLSDNDAKTLVSWVNSQYEAAKSGRSQIQIQWGMNMLMYRGKQYAEFGNSLKKFHTPAAPPYRVRHTTNLIRPLIRNEIAKLTTQKPSASVIPASSDDDDLFSAQAGEQVWEYLYSNRKIHEVYRRMTFWEMICGTAFIKTWWDQSHTDPDGQQGDLRYGHVTPFHLYVPDLREEDIEQQPYLINVYTRPVETLEKAFGDKLGHPLKATTVSTNDIISDAYLDLQGQADKKPDSCLVMETWLKPGAHKQFPNGGLLTTIDDQVVQFSADGLPYNHGEYPFAQFNHIPSGKFYADSSIVDVISLQREYNRTLSQVIEAKNRIAKPKMLTQKGAIDVNKVNTEAGQFIEYRMGYERPSALVLPEIPTYVFNHAQMMRADFEDVTGQHQVSKGSAPAGVTAATAINFLQEKDDSYSTHTYQSAEAGMEKIARQSLSLVVQYWDTPRLVRVVGSDNAFDAMTLQGSDIASGTDIKMEAGSSLPTSKAAKQQFLMDLMSRGFIPPEKGLELMDMGGIQKLYDEIKIDERQAQRENLRMRRLDDETIQAHYATPQQVIQGAAGPGVMDAVSPGAPGVGGMGFDPNNPGAPAGPVDVATGAPLEPLPVVPVNTWDNHQIHIQVHNNFRKSQAFDNLSDAIKQEFEKHVTAHIAALGATQAAMGPPMGPGGGPGGPGGAPGGVDASANNNAGGSNQFNSIPGGSPNGG